MFSLRSLQVPRVGDLAASKDSSLLVGETADRIASLARACTLSDVSLSSRASLPPSLVLLRSS